MILQVHYHPTGKPEVDRTRIGIYFSGVPVKQALHWSTASNSEFLLPAGKGFAGRVAPGDCSPGAPTDPDVRISRIWLVTYVAARLSRRGPHVL